MRMVRNSCFKVCSCKVKLLTGNGKTDEGLNQVWRVLIPLWKIWYSVTQCLAVKIHGKRVSLPKVYKSDFHAICPTKVLLPQPMSRELIVCLPRTMHDNYNAGKKFSLTKTDNYIDKGSPLMKRKKKVCYFLAERLNSEILGLALVMVIA